VHGLCRARGRLRNGTKPCRSRRIELLGSSRVAPIMAIAVAALRDALDGANVSLLAPARPDASGSWQAPAPGKR